MSKQNIQPQNTNPTLFVRNLELAIKLGRVKDVQLLLDLKLDDSHLNAALKVATQYNRREVLEKLERKSYNEMCDGDSVAGDWFHAAHQNDATCIQKLLRDTRIDLNIQDSKGQTALHINANRYGKIAELLLSLSNFDPNIQDHEGNTVLHKASQNGNLALCKAILTHKKTNPNIFNVNGDSALSFAIDKESIEIVRLIIDHSNINLNAQNHYGNTILHHAISEAMKALRDNPEYDLSIINLLLDRHIDTNIQNQSGMTVLHSVVENGGDPILINLLINFGADCNLVDNNDRTAYEIAKETNSGGANIYSKQILNLLLPTQSLMKKSHHSTDETGGNIYESSEDYYNQHTTLVGQDSDDGL